ncbi:MAG TPA: dienelactone hydrolase family protein [Thermomicrobiales bacterium]|nr:dienelactone hydrolase family protein [Thermomicrobiales bacterium]
MVPLGPFENYLVHEFVEDYHEGLMSRRDMIRRVLHITGSVGATVTVLTALGVVSVPRAIAAQEAATPSPSGPRSPLSVSADDPRVVTEEITFPSGDVTIMAYQAAPSGREGATPSPAMAASPASNDGGLPVVLVCHENRGLTDHIRDVTRRWAVEGYIACAVDLLSRQGGTAAISDQASIPGLLTGVDPSRHVADFQAAIDHYRGQEGVDAGRVGMNGFCFGGGITWRAVTQIQDLTAAAPYYGPPPPLDQVPNIKAAVFAVYSDDPSDFANNGRDDLKAALDKAGVTFEFKVYPNTQHAFNNDTGPRYNEAVSNAAWKDVTGWFATYLKG